jgi:hypothetical protein
MCGNTRGQNCHTKASRKESEIQEFMYTDTANVEHGIYDYTGHNWSHRNGNKCLKNVGSHTQIIFNRRTTKYSYPWNIANNTESTAV